MSAVIFGVQSVRHPTAPCSVNGGILNKAPTRVAALLTMIVTLSLTATGCGLIPDSLKTEGDKTPYARTVPVSIAPKGDGSEAPEGSATVVPGDWDGQAKFARIDKCDSNVVVIGARGSGESSDSGRTDSEPYFGGFGDEVAAGARELRNLLSSSTKIKFVPLGYTAAGAMHGLLPEIGRILTQDPVYDDSVANGVILAKLLVRQVAQLCPGTAIVLMGFSQGSQVMHAVSADPAIAPLLKAVWLISDATRNPLDRGVLTYTGGATGWGPPVVSAGEGIVAIGSLFPPVLAGDPAGSSTGGRRSRVVSVCDQMDSVCNHNGSLDMAAMVAGFNLHGNAYKESGSGEHFHKFPASYIAGLIDDWTLRNPGGARILDPKKSTSCEADVVILGSRGAKEEYGAGQIPGFGDAASAAAMNFVRHVPLDTRVLFTPVREAGEPRSVSIGVTPEYFAAVASRTLQTVSAMTSVAECPSTHVVAIGYDMGAQAFHEAIPTLSAVQRARVIGAWLIGDPSRSSSENAWVEAGGGGSPGNVWEADGETPGRFVPRGTYSAKGGVFDQAARPFPADLKDLVVSVCSFKDPVCNGYMGTCDPYEKSCQDARGWARTEAQFAEGARIHATGYQESRFIDLPSQWLSSQLRQRTPYQPSWPYPVILSDG